MRARRWCSTCSIVLGGWLASACGGETARAPAPMYSSEQLDQLARPVPSEVPDAGAPVVAASTVATAPADQAPEWLDRDVPASVIAGRDVAFGLDVVDEDMESPRIEMVSLPDGAEFDARTETVHWRVPASMRGAQSFVVRVTGGHEGAPPAERTITVQVLPHASAPARPEGAPPLVGALVTITAPAYLARAAREWPITRVLEVTRDAAIDALPTSAQPAVERRSGAALFDDLLSALAQQHANPRLDPASPQFDHRFERAHWRLVAVRPRVNKHVEELRLAYQAVDVPEPVFAMFRVRLFRGANPPSPAVAAANNTAFTQLVHDAFFDATRPKPGIAEGRAPAVSAAVATLVHSVMTFRDAHEPLLRTGLVAIPEEARMGGGNALDAHADYAAGNGWAFTVANLAIDAAAPEGGARRAIHVVNVPVSAFAFDLDAAPSGDHFTAVCPPRYREGGAGNEPGLASMCEADGTVRIAERAADGHWVRARRDSLGEHRDVTHGEMLAHVALADPRRRNFEENGMTCVQCHMRNFDDGVFAEVQVRDPRVHAAVTPARPVPRVPMQILPVANVARSSYLEQQETFQLCDLGRHFRDQLHVEVSLPCPEGY